MFAFYFPWVVFEKEKKILRLFISDYFLKWVTLWCNCNTTPAIKQHQLYSWLNGVKIKPLNGIRTNELLHFSVSSCIFHNPSRVCFFLSNISILPSPTCEPWKLSSSLPLADNPYQNSCTHKTLTMSWLSLCSDPAVWVNSSWWTEPGMQGAPGPYLLMWLTSCRFLWALQAKSGSLPVATGTREHQESLKPFHVPLSISIWHPLLLSTFPRAIRRPCWLRLWQVLTLCPFYTHY